MAEHEHRSSISSLGPEFQSMALQHFKEDFEENPPLSTIHTQTKEEKLINSGSGNCDSGHMLVKSSSASTKGAGVNPSLTSGGHQQVTVTSTTPSFASSLYLDNTNDGFTMNNANSPNETITIDMIQTLPIYDPVASASNGDVYNNSLRCYISNMIMPTANCKSSCTVRNVTSLSNVLLQITDFLRIQCISYTIQYTPTTVAFHCERNSAFANLVGPSLVFVIYLWYEQEAVPPKSENDNDVDITAAAVPKHPPILIDVQRRRGCPLDLKCIRRSLFRSLLNTECCAEEVDTRKGMIPIEICRSIRTKYIFGKKGNKKNNDDATAGHSSVSEEDLQIEQINSATSETMELLVYYQTMLELTNTDESHRMGLECLCQNTDSTVTDVTKSKPVIEAIIFGTMKSSNDDGKAADANNVIIEKFRVSLLRFVTTPVEAPELTPVLATAGCAPKNLQCLALRALFTSLNAYVTAMAEPSAMICIENDSFWYSVLQTCRQGIVTSNTAPCFAAVSMMLICTLLTNSVSSEASQDIIYDVLNQSSTIYDDLNRAHTWGQRHHTYLEAASQQLLELLECKNGVRL